MQTEYTMQRRVLVVDDSPDNVWVLEFLLAEAGCDVRSCTTAADAIAETKRFCPDVVFLDLSLQARTDGLEVAQDIRTTHAATSPLVAALTAWARPQDREAAIDAGCDLYFVKPADPVVLIDVALHGLRPLDTQKERSTT
jgi:CheY-like chemotaxis protein